MEYKFNFIDVEKFVDTYNNLVKDEFKIPQLSLGHDALEDIYYGIAEDINRGLVKIEKIHCPTTGQMHIAKCRVDIPEEESKTGFKMSVNVDIEIVLTPEWIKTQQQEIAYSIYEYQIANECLPYDLDSEDDFKQWYFNYCYENNYFNDWRC